MGKCKYVYKLRKKEEHRAASTIRYEKFIKNKSDSNREEYFEKKIKILLEKNPKRKRVMCKRIINKIGNCVRNKHKYRERKVENNKKPTGINYVNFVKRMCDKRSKIHYELKKLHKRRSESIFYKTGSIVPLSLEDKDMLDGLENKIKKSKEERLNHDRNCHNCFC